MAQNPSWKENQPWNQSGNTPLSDQERAFDLLYQEKALMGNIAADLQCDIGRVSVKATRGEKMGFIGHGEGVLCQAVVLLEEDDVQKNR